MSKRITQGNAFVLCLLLAACAGTKQVAGPTFKPQLRDGQTFVITELSDDKTYGYTENNPINVGGVKTSEGPLNERRFLNALEAPNGNQITYVRLGSCCPFKTPNGMIDNMGMLDKYKVEWVGQAEPVILFINMYDYGELKCPLGLAIKK